MAFEGDIGPQFYEQLKQNFSRYPGYKFLCLQSNGGLVDEALKAGPLIQDSGVGTYVSNHCHSACIILFAAGVEQWASGMAKFGFHATYPIAQNRYSSIPLDEIQRESEEFLKSHGVPTSIIDTARRYGPGELYLLDAAKLKSNGFQIEILQ